MATKTPHTRELSDAQLAAEIERLADLDDITRDDDARLDDLLRERDRRRIVGMIERGEVSTAPGSTSDPETTRQGPTFWRKRDPWVAPLPDDREDRRSAAITAVERTAGSDDMKAAATRMLETYDPREQGDMARWATECSNPDYVRAWAKMFVDPQRGHQLWSEAERAAFARVDEFTRSIANTSNATGAGLSLPLSLDPAVGISNNGKLNPLGRQLARQVSIVGTDTWRKNRSAGVVANFAAELSEVADGSPTFGVDDIKAHKWHAFAQASFEAWQDVADLPGELTRLFLDAADVLEAEKLMDGAGDGSDEPWGVVTRLTGTTTSQVYATTAGEFSFGDVVRLDEALPTRFRPNSAWMADRKVMNLTRQFASGSAPQAGEYWADAREGMPATLLGQNIYEADTALGFTASTNGSDVIAVLGDWSEAYAVVRRAPTTIVDVPVMVGTTNNLPIGARGWYVFGRTGADTTILNAARALLDSDPS